MSGASAPVFSGPQGRPPFSAPKAGGVVPAQLDCSGDDSEAHVTPLGKRYRFIPSHDDVIDNPYRHQFQRLFKAHCDSNIRFRGIGRE